MLKVGLTGGIGSGKSTVTKYFQVLGVPVIDADDIARALVSPGMPAYHEIIKLFGVDVLNQDQALDRRKLRTLIFSDACAKGQLEALLHPLIYQTINQKMNLLNSVYCVVAVPLLIETDQLSLVDRILVVDVSPELQVTRTLQRDGGSRAQIEVIINNQVGRQTRLSYADNVLDNSGSTMQLKSDIDKLHRQYLGR